MPASPPPDKNPLLSTDARDWDQLIEALGPASLLVIIERRMSHALRARLRSEDVLQEVLLLVWRDRERIEWRGLAAFRNFLLQAINHRLLDLAKFEGAQRRGGDGPRPLFSQIERARDSEASAFLDRLQTTTPSRVAILREEAEAMNAALEALPDELREIVRLRLFEEVATEAVAERLGLGLSAVKHRFRKGSALYRERLRSELASRPSETPANS